jgi:hypothetical protein
MNHSAVRLLATFGVLVSTCAAYAQTPPRPAVRISQLRQFAQDTWPADVNRDGRTDLVGSAGHRAASEVAVSIGRGDGTFAAPRTTGVAASPVAVGDFNNDGRIDVVVSGVAILPGNGDGTFGSARPVTGAPSPPVFPDDLKTSHALAADFNADGRRDLGLITASSFDIHPGNGDFTFGPPISLPVGDASSGGPRQAISADFNGDGRRDIAVMTFFNSIDVFLNRGGLVFAASTATVAQAELWGITAGDLNRDNRADLIVVSTNFGLEPGSGQVFTLLNKGDGTFHPSLAHPTANGSLTVVVGDFNRDGLLDAATGNRSWVYRDLTCAPSLHYWDSVSILAGKGDGTLAAPATFHLDYSNDDHTYQNTHNSLKTSDVNGDGRTDLIASPGAVLLNAAPAANRPPMLFEGPDLMVTSEHFARFIAEVRDPDYDMVSIVWRDNNSGQVLGDTPDACNWFISSTTVTATLTDARGASVTQTLSVLVPQPADDIPYVAVNEPDKGETVSATTPFTIRFDANPNDPRQDTIDVWSSSNDGETWTRVPGCSNLPPTARECRWAAPGPVSSRAFIRVVAYDNGVMSAFAVSDRFSIVSGPATSLPDLWVSGDIGTPVPPGSATFDGSAFTVRGAGTGIKGTADEFHFARIAAGGDFSITARVTRVDNVSPSTRVGIMIREWTGGGPGERHASLLVTPTTTAFMRRTTVGGGTISTAGPATTAPIWLKLLRTGNTIRAFYRKQTTSGWTLLGSQSFTGLSSHLIAMLVVSSHADGTVATGQFDNVVVDTSEPMQSVDIGTSVAGRTSSNGVTITMEGNGAGIWGTADAFRYRYTQWVGDGTVTARLRGLENTSTGAKAGVMFRETLDANSKHVMGAVYAAGGVVLQLRSATGGASSEAARRAGSTPEWVQLRRSGDTFTLAASNDGMTWTTVGSTTVAMHQVIYVGLPVTSRVAGTLATAVFDDVVIEP